MTNPDEPPDVASASNDQTRAVELLKGIVLIIISLGYVYDYFHGYAILNGASGTEQPGFAFLIKDWAIHYCTPVFVFLTGISAFLSGQGKTQKDFTGYLLKRGLLFVIAEFIIDALGSGFNPSYPIFDLNALWITGFSMIVLSALARMGRKAILLAGILLIVVHNVISAFHPEGFHYLAVLGYPNEFVLGHFTFSIHAPVLPCISIIAIGYYFGSLFVARFHPEIRNTTLFCLGAGAVAIFLALRISDPSGDSDQWLEQKNAILGILFFLDVSEPSSSILYVLITLGPAMLLLSRFGKPLNRFGEKIAVFGRMPLYYFVIYVCLLHVFVTAGKMIAGYFVPDLVPAGNLGNAPVIKVFDFTIPVVYFIWIVFVILLYPCCKWFDGYKRTHRCTHWWLCYL